MLLWPSVSVIAGGDAGSGGGGFAQKLRGVCPELTIKADHSPEAHEEK